MVNNPHEHCGAAWRHLRDSLIAILGDRLPENPRGYSDADIHNAVRELADEADVIRNVAQDLTDYGIDHTYKCVQFGKPLMETMIGGDIPCTCGLSDLVNRAYKSG